MEEKPEEDVVVINKVLPIVLVSLIFVSDISAQSTYKKRVLETVEIDVLSSFYNQNGDNAAVSGGIGDEKLLNATPTIVITIPINADDILTIDAGISAYSSASSSNVNPFDGNSPAGAFVESSGASKADVLRSAGITYSHYSDDRNTIYSANASVSYEYDYFSVGFGGSFSKLFNDKNTEFSISTNVYLDNWSLIYPIELRGSGGEEGFNRNRYTITGNANYDPNFTELGSGSRNSYSIGLLASQILTLNLQASVSLDLVYQDGLLSTPFQRVYFSDVDDSFIDNFHLADDIERLPSSRSKLAAGTRLNYYVNEYFVLRSYYRFYIDDWGITSNTASLEIPVKLSDKFTIYPSYRFYNQTAADQFAAYNSHISTSKYYTSDYDLSKFDANQFGFGFNYYDLFTSFSIGPIALKNIDVKYYRYERSNGLNSNLITFGLNFILDQ